MRRIAMLLTAALLLAGCAAKRTDARAEALQSRYAGLAGCRARAVVTVVGEEETQRFTLELSRAGDETRVAVCEPEELAGVSAVVRGGKQLALEFDGMVLDAGSADPRVSALNCFDLLLRAAAEGCVAERSAEDYGDAEDALRLCFETEQGGEKLLVAAYFDAEDRPLYAEVERGGEILAFLEFTDFQFCDTISE